MYTFLALWFLSSIILCTAWPFFIGKEETVTNNNAGEWTERQWEGERVWRCACPPDDNHRGFRNPMCVNCRTVRPEETAK